MKIGKSSPRTLLARVYPHLGRRPDVLVHAGIGQDSAVLDFGPEVCIITCDPITGASDHLGRLAVHVACNDLAATGAEPVGVLLTLLLPQGAGENDLERIMRDAGRAAREVGVEIVGGHTEVTPAVAQAVVVATAVGRAPRGGYVSAAGGSPGDSMVMTKSAGIEGTAILASDFAERLQSALDPAALERARSLIHRISVVPEGRIAAGSGATAMHDVTEGGVLTGAWEMAEASGCGVRLDCDAVPVLEETRAICEALGLDPLGLIGSGALLIATPDPGHLCSRLRAEGVECAVVGELRAGPRLLVRDGNASPLEPLERDELFRLLDLSGDGPAG